MLIQVLSQIQEQMVLSAKSALLLAAIMAGAFGTILLGTFGVMVAEVEAAAPTTIVGVMIFTIVALLGALGWVIKWMAAEIKSRSEQLDAQRKEMLADNEVERNYRSRDREQQAKFFYAILGQRQQAERTLMDVNKVLLEKLDKVEKTLSSRGC